MTSQVCVIPQHLIVVGIQVTVSSSSIVPSQVYTYTVLLLQFYSIVVLDIKQQISSQWLTHTKQRSPILLILFLVEYWCS